MAPLEADPHEWLLRADADLAVAVAVLRDPALPDWAAGFHLQQAVEKALKAVLTAHGRPAPRTHDIALLSETVELLVAALAGWGEKLLPLGEFSVTQRYPGAPEPKLDLRRMADDVRAFLGAVRGETKPPSSP